MPVIYDAKHQIFNLQTVDTSYLLGIYKGKLLIHIHYGKRIEKLYDALEMMDRVREPLEAFSVTSKEYSGQLSHNMQLLELPVYGDGDFRCPGFHAEYADGSIVTKFYYTGHRIYDGKPELSDLPSAYVESSEEAQTLELYLEDALTGMHAVLNYTVYPERNMIVRSNRYSNGGNQAVNLLRVDSGILDFDHDDFDFVHFSGAWARERRMERHPLFHGLQQIDSSRGFSGHFQNPFVCLASHDALEDTGEVYGVNLIYSGNFHAGVYSDPQGRIRLFHGIHPFDFRWKLESGESFQTPECVMTYSDQGFGKMSRTFHKFIRERICRGKFRDLERPILLNNWEATYFDFDEDKIVSIAKKASELGIDLMVMDDGWFGSRNNDTSSLGDWIVNMDKLPNGLSGLAERVNSLGMKFGLWMEPEMVSEKSELYLSHPDWCLHVEGRSRSEGRHQLVLDLSREEVCNHIIQTVSRVLTEANIEYIKWDANRYLTEVCSKGREPDRQRETAHRYILGLYKVLGTLKKKFPNVLWECCSGGGGRFDLGMLCYFDQCQVSDDTDALERQYIQTGTSYGYPTFVMGAHVSACPNHQTGRITPMQTRGYVALAGQFGYELDLSLLTEKELDEVKSQIRLCRELAHVFHKGDMYRLKSPFDGNMTAWEFVSEDKATVIVEIFVIKDLPESPYQNIRLRGLNPQAVYEESQSGKRYSGEMLMYMGLKRKMKRDFSGELLILRKQI